MPTENSAPFAKATPLHPQEFPILEFDPSAEAILNPRDLIEQRDLPERWVLCFFLDVIERIVRESGGRQVLAHRAKRGRSRSTR